MEIQSKKLVYFSPTGTTKKIIEGIARGISFGPVETVDITKPEARKQQLQTSENDLLVIGVPVYSGRAPAVAIGWLAALKARRTPAVCVVVYGNRAYDDALLELKDAVVRQGCVPFACAAFIGEHSFSSAETPVAAGRPDAGDVDHAESFGKKINEKLLAVPAVDQISGITVPGSYPYKEFKPLVLDFIAVNDQCSQCGVCARVCPAGAVDTENSSLIDQEKCILCCACIKNCPQNARSVKAGTVKDLAKRLNQMCQKRRDPEFFI